MPVFSRRWHALICLAMATAMGADRHALAKAPATLSPARIQAVAAMLPATPSGVGRPITDRAAWQRAAATPALKGAIAAGNALLKQPIPEMTEELYSDYSRTGNRSRGEAVLRARHSRIQKLVVAECLENRGRILPAIEEAIRAVCAERSWLLPAHDRGMQTYNGKTMWIDLSSVAVSWNLATAAYWLGDRLSPEARALIVDELERRTFAPFESYLATGEPGLWWMTGTNNWNAVCLAGVTGAALATIESPRRRAVFAVAAEKYIQNFLSGFTPDGYCSEGVGYYNYGFGHFVMLAETLERATHGGVDLFARPNVRQIATFGPRMEIVPGIYPAFADCSTRAQPNPNLLAHLNRRFGFGWKGIEERAATDPKPPRTLFELGLTAFATSIGTPDKTTAPSTAETEHSETERGLRHWFADAQVLICRPTDFRADGFGVALKGGHNAEHHNHNDLGSFVVAWQGKTPIVDPGAEVYTARTFSGHRYDSQLLNSYGHSVPIVAGKLQRPGRQAAARIVKTEFTDAQDTLVIDITSAYDVKALKRLQRTFVFSRQGDGQLLVTDEVEFDSPQSFGTALITFSPERRIQGRTILIGTGREAVRVDVASDDAEIAIDENEIKEDLHGKVQPIRIGIDLAKPVTSAKLRMTIGPGGGVVSG